MAENSVFVIEQGSYSDYRVVGVFSTLDAAEKACALINDGERWDKAEVAEWPLDPGVAQMNQGLAIWHVTMARDGSVERAELSRLVGSEISEGEGFCVVRRRCGAAVSPAGFQELLVATIWAEDEKHAVKITNEKRAQMIAMDQWNPT